MRQMETATHANVSLVQQSTTSSEDLAHQANRLTEIVAVFRSAEVLLPALEEAIAAPMNVTAAVR